MVARDESDGRQLYLVAPPPLAAGLAAVVGAGAVEGCRFEAVEPLQQDPSDEEGLGGRSPQEQEESEEGPQVR